MSSFKDGPEGYCPWCARIVAAIHTDDPDMLMLMTHWLGKHKDNPNVPGLDAQCKGSLLSVGTRSAARAPRADTRFAFRLTPRT